MPDASTTGTSLSLIHWQMVFTSSLWILGLSVIVASFSYHRWLAGERGASLRQPFPEPSWSVSFATGMALVCAGFGLGRDVAWWERGLWLALTLSFGWQLVQAIRATRRATRGADDSCPAVKRLS